MSRPSTTRLSSTTRFADLDKYLMETAVPWVPWSFAQNLVFTSPTVTQYAYDDFSGDISFSHTAVNNGKQPVNVATT